MARFTHAVRRTGGLSPASAPAVLLTVLLALIALLGAPALVGPPLHAPDGTAPAARATSAHSAPCADDAEPSACAAAPRSHRDATGERHAPPAADPLASRGSAVDLLPPTLSPLPTTGSPAPEQPAHRHGVRAPPSHTGT
ncbi:hypothetical protein [Streptomyces zaehneri]|uniref:hypothetical protein n=1 Tax=Streptomyces zaehneri TaxID=3051180 RepID=UPI0028D7FCE2|nr:hypothetical protein [Streptomyces sp. DSM 40713]